MKYKLYDNEFNMDKVILSALKHRGVKNPDEYMNLTDDVLIPYSKLDNIDKAVECFVKHYECDDKITVLFDSDTDGVTSGSAMFNYIRKLKNDYRVSYLLHTKHKAHGLSEDVVIPEDTKLLIIPDAATNDIEQCKAISKQGIDIIILDHHNCDVDNKYAIVVNNQLSKNYTNKELSGVGVTYKFLQALDEYFREDYADDFLDLVALGNIGDNMDIRSLETKRLIAKGLSKINNKGFKALISAQDYSMGGKVNIHNVQWSIVPLINGMIRIGTDEELEILAKSFIETDETFEYNKRATKSAPAQTIQETVYDRCARLCKNAKSRQDKLRTKALENIMDVIVRNDRFKNDKVIMVDTTGIMEDGLTGVVAIKVAETLNKPCLLLTPYIKNKDKKEKYFGGSGRNIDHSPIESLQKLCEKTETFEFATGHDNAFGICIKADNVDKARDTFNTLLENVEYDATYLIDMLVANEEISVELINECMKFQDYTGTGIDDIEVGVTDICINRKDFVIKGATENTLSFKNDNDIEFIKFKCSADDKLLNWVKDEWAETNTIKLNIVGKPNISEYQGFKTPQIIIDNYNIVETFQEEEFDINAEEIEDGDDIAW